MNNSEPEILFDEGKHEYRVGGILTPSVSAILKANGLMDNFRPNETKLSNGTAIHRTLELHDKGALDYSNLDPRLQKCLDLWQDFKHDFGIKILAVEQKVNMGVLYAGTIDRVAECDGNPAVIDFKSGVPQSWAALQTAAYAMAYSPSEYKKYERFCLQIHWDLDRVKFKPYTNKEDFNVFMGMCTTYHWKKNHGYLKEESYGNN